MLLVYFLRFLDFFLLLQRRFFLYLETYRMKEIVSGKGYKNASPSNGTLNYFTKIVLLILKIPIRFVIIIFFNCL